MKKHIFGYIVLGALAVGGTSATAATMITGRQVRDNSLTGRDIRNSSIIGRDVRNSSLTGGDIMPRSIDVTDLAASAVIAGPPGPAGTAGIASIGIVDGPAGFQCAGGGACQVASSTATCPPGSRVVGGGFEASSLDTFVLVAKASTTTYHVIADNTGPFSGTIRAQAVCAAGPGIQLASAARASSVASEVAAKLSRFRAQAEQRASR